MGYHSGNCRPAQSLSGLFILFVALVTLGGASPAWAAKAPKITDVERDLTTNAILVRTGLKPCTTKKSEQELAGSQLEMYFHTRVEEIPEKAYTKAEMKRLTTAECLKACTCSARLTIVSHAPKARLAEYSKSVLEETLRKMTDDDYAKCRKAISNICERPEVKEFLDQIAEELK